MRSRGKANALGTLIHFGNSAALGALFGAVAEPHLPGSPVVKGSDLRTIEETVLYPVAALESLSPCHQGGRDRAVLDVEGLPLELAAASSPMALCSAGSIRSYGTSDTKRPKGRVSLEPVGASRRRNDPRFVASQLKTATALSPSSPLPAMTVTASNERPAVSRSIVTPSESTRSSWKYSHPKIRNEPLGRRFTIGENCGRSAGLDALTDCSMCKARPALAGAPPIRDSVGQIGALLDLVDEDSRPERMDQSRFDQQRIALRARHGVRARIPGSRSESPQRCSSEAASERTPAISSAPGSASSTYHASVLPRNPSPSISRARASSGCTWIESQSAGSSSLIKSGKSGPSASNTGCPRISTGYASDSRGQRRPCHRTAGDRVLIADDPRLAPGRFVRSQPRATPDAFL